MLRQRPIQHRRKNSQLDLFYPQHHVPSPSTSTTNNSKGKSKKASTQKPSTKPKLSLESKKNHQHNNQLNGDNILRLVENSQRKIHNKKTVIEDIELSGNVKYQYRRNDKNDENVDCSNGEDGCRVNGCNDNRCQCDGIGDNYDYQNNYDLEQEQSESFFQFGRNSTSNSRTKYSSIIKDPLPTTHPSPYLNMQQILEVPDTMSNQRRYDNSNSNSLTKHFYNHFPLSANQANQSNRNSLGNFSSPLMSGEENLDLQQKEADTLESRELGKNKEESGKQSKVRGFQLEATSKNLKKRKEKIPKNVVIIEGNLNHNDQTKDKFDLSQLSKANKKSKLFFVNTKKDQHTKKSKSKENLISTRIVQKQKSRSSLFLNKKSKNLSQSILLPSGAKKKSLSLKSNPKTQGLRLSENNKPKSYSKQKDLSQTKSSLHFVPKPTKSTSSLSRSTQKPTSLQNPSKNLQIGQKIMIIEESQSKLQNQYKILWECVGQLWENSRITRYISEKNKSDIMKLKDGEKQQDEKLIKLKSQILSSIASARY